MIDRYIEMQAEFKTSAFGVNNKIVGDITLMTPGIYNGDFFSPDVLQSFDPPILPVPVTHGHVSSLLYKDHKIYEEECIGNVFSIHGNREGISGTAVIDEFDLLRKVGDEEYKRFISGEALDVSVGIHCFGTDEEDFWKVNAFSLNHVAILRCGEGACSVDDGCGVRKKEMKKKYALGVARRPTYNGTETTPWESVDKTLGAFIDAYYSVRSTKKPDDAPSDVKNMPARMKNWIASHTLLGDPKATDERDLIFFPVVNPATGKLSRGALVAVMGARGTAADISAEAKKSAKAVAIDLFEKEFRDKKTEKKQEMEIMIEQVEKIDELDNKNVIDIVNQVNQVKQVDVVVDPDIDEFRAFKKTLSDEIKDVIFSDSEKRPEKCGLDELPLKTLRAIKDFISAIQAKKYNDDESTTRDATTQYRGAVAGEPSTKHDDTVPEMPRMPWLKTA